MTVTSIYLIIKVLCLENVSPVVKSDVSTNHCYHSDHSDSLTFYCVACLL